MTKMQRTTELSSFRAEDTADSPVLKHATELAAALFDCPMASVNLIDDDTQWLLGRTGLDPCSTDRQEAFCNLTLDRSRGSVLIVENAALDARFSANPLVTGDPGIRFYAGAPLVTSNGFNLGALCVIDTVPRARPSEANLTALTTLADLVVAELERGRSERRRRQQQDMLDMAEAMSGVGHWLVRIPSNQIVWSDEVYVIHGVDPETYDPSYDDAIAFYDPADQKLLTAAIEATMKGQGPYQLEMSIVRRDGEPRRVMAKGACAFDPEGQPVLLYGVFQDVTENRAALAAAEEAATVKADFLANMSHELRTPLTSIIGFTDLTLAREDLADVTRGYVRRIDNAGRSLLCLVNDILDFSKLEAGQVAIRPEPTDVERLCRDVLELFAPQIGAKDLSLDLSVTPAGLHLEIDPDRVRQILLNLVSNAVKFTETGHVELSIAWNASTGMLTGAVEDTGPGMTKEQLDRLFQRFSQVDGSATRKSGGTGLGLAICKGLSEAMGGGVGAESTPGVGSRFWFTLAAQPAKGAAPAVMEAPVDTGGASLTGVRVLIADDHPANRELARLFLHGLGAEVEQAEDGVEAVDMAGRTAFDVILMDARMPRMDGEQALAEIRKGGASQKAPILAYSADVSDHDAGDWIARGFQGVVAKPLSSQALIAAVRDAVEASEAVSLRATG